MSKKNKENVMVFKSIRGKSALDTVITQNESAIREYKERKLVAFMMERCKSIFPKKTINWVTINDILQDIFRDDDFSNINISTKSHNEEYKVAIKKRDVIESYKLNFFYEKCYGEHLDEFLVVTTIQTHTPFPHVKVLHKKSFEKIDNSLTWHNFADIISSLCAVAQSNENKSKQIQTGE